MHSNNNESYPIRLLWSNIKPGWADIIFTCILDSKQVWENGQHPASSRPAAGPNGGTWNGRSYVILAILMMRSGAAMPEVRDSQRLSNQIYV